MSKKYKNRLKINRYERLEKNDNGTCCDSPNITSQDGEIVCTNCGLVIGNEIIETELRAYNLEEIEQRKRTEIKWRDFGPRTLLPNTSTDSKGNLIDSKGKHLFSRLSKIQKSLVSSIERNFWEAKPKLKMLSTKLNLPDYIRETSWKIYSTAAQKKLTMGRSIDGFITASVYAAIRIHESPRLLDEVCDASMNPRRVVHHSLGLIVKEVLPELKLKYSPITAEQLVFRFGNDLGLSMKSQKIAMNLLIKATKNGLSRTGKDPRGFAASVIYMAAKKTGERKTQTEISDVAKITEVTLRSRIKEIKSQI